MKHEVGIPAVDHQEADLLRNIFGRKWRFDILKELVKGPVRVSSLRRSIPRCSKKMIIETLQDLQHLSWVERKDFFTSRKRVEYRLTRLHEEKLAEIISSLRDEI